MNIKTSDLTAALAEISPIVGKRMTLPILSMVHLEASRGVLEIAASDLNCWATVKVDCAGDLDPICVTFNSLNGLAKCSGEHITLTLEKEKLVMSSNGTAKLSTLPAVEFPSAPREALKALGVTALDLAECIEGVAWAAGENPTNYLCQGVWVKTSAKEISCMGTDLKRAAMCSRGVIAGASEFLFPHEYAALLCAALRSDGAKFSTGEKWISCEHKHGSCFIILMEGKYFTTKAFWDREHKELGKVDTAPLLDALHSALTVANGDPFPYISMTFAGDDCKFLFEGKTNQFKTELPIKGACEPIWMNAALAQDVLRHTPEGPELDVYDNAILFRSGDFRTSLALCRAPTA